MVERLKSGTSTNNLLPSEQDTTTNLGTSRVQEEPIKCKSGAPTLDGSSFLNMKQIISATLMQEEENVLKFNMERTKKDTL
jgi:hypothetical protein